MWKLTYIYFYFENTVYSYSKLELELLRSKLENNKLISYASSVTFDYNLRVVK